MNVTLPDHHHLSRRPLYNDHFTLHLMRWRTWLLLCAITIIIKVIVNVRDEFLILINYLINSKVILVSSSSLLLDDDDLERKRCSSTQRRITTEDSYIEPRLKSIFFKLPTWCSCAWPGSPLLMMMMIVDDCGGFCCVVGACATIAAAAAAVAPWTDTELLWVGEDWMNWLCSLALVVVVVAVVAVCSFCRVDRDPIDMSHWIK